METGERSVEPKLIEANMTVRDADGEKIGTVAHLHQPVAVGGPAFDVAAATVIEVKTGFLGKGERLYVPFAAVGGLARNDLLLTEPRHAIENQHPEWRTRPANLPAEGIGADRSRRHARPDDWFRPLG